MSDFLERSEAARIDALAQGKPISELAEIIEPGQRIKKPSMPDFKTRMNALKAKLSVTKQDETPKSIPENTPNNEAPVHENKDETLIATLHPNIEVVPGDMAHPQNELEALVEADRQFAAKVTNDNVEKDSEKLLTAEALFTESLAERSMDRERFKQVFINTVQSECAGLSLDEIEESIRRDHEMLFDKRTGIQAKLAYRSELLKDATAEERAKRLKDDWLFKPNKKSTEEKKSAPSKGGNKKAAFDPAAAMRNALKAKGLTDEQVKARLAKFGL